MMQMKLWINTLSHFIQDIKDIYKWEEVILFLILFNLCITNVIR